MKKILSLSLIICLLLSGCAPAPYTHHFFGMDTVMTVQLADGDEADALACEALVSDLEKKWSVTLPESEISLLNAQGELEVSQETMEILALGQKIAQESEGAFSLSLYPASCLWGFGEKKPRVPSAEELAAVRPLIGDEKIALNENTATLQEGMALDLGGIAKGYAADKIAGLLKERQVEHYFLSLGGNVQVGGGRADGSPWRIGIADPEGGEPIGILELTDGAVVTSGSYQRNFTQDGILYHHILDPQTLAPAQSGLRSATIIGPKGAEADGYSTAAFVLGEEKGMAFCRARGVDCIMITEDGRAVVSQGLKGNFRLTDDRYVYEEK